MTRILLIFALCAAPLPSLAHKVIVGVFPAGSAIEGEIGFSSGDMATDTEVIIRGPDGTELGRTTTDADGFFMFKPTVNVAHRFQANLGAGHVADVTMPASEIAAILGEAAPPQPAQAEVGALASSPSLIEAQNRAIAEAVRNELRPLRREIAAYREKNDIQTILGGIGYIAGLFGLGFYLAARRKLAA